MLQDLRYAIRMMRRAPMFSAAVILTSALAIAANTTIFTVVNAVLVHPLPFRDPDRLVQVAEKNDSLNLPTFTVVGVVGDVRSTALNQESPALYYPVAWRVWPVMDVVVRTWVANSAAQPRLDSVLLAIFAGVALVIAAIGIYGVLAYSVSQRTREIGLRIAVGARPASVVRLVVAEGMTVAAVGICVGLLVASATGRALASLLYGVQPRDPATFGFIAAALTFVAVAACAIPARRAARVDPMVALRHE